MKTSKIKVGVVGGTGYTGVELIRLLARHPNADVTTITSRGEAGIRIDEIFPSLRGVLDLTFSSPDEAKLEECDLVFFAAPNGISMRRVRPLLERGVRVIDLAADFRLRDANEWQHWYGMPHACPDLLAEAVYGLPEVNREKIRAARLIANPGCYPTAVQLGFVPLLEAGIVDEDFLIADCKSGMSGAGRKAELPTLFGEAAENFKAYAAGGHRHLPEISQGLNRVSAKPVSLTFLPHLTPMIRGIHASLYARLKVKVDLQELYQRRYANEYFIDVMPSGSHPETRSVRGANMCRIAVHQPQDSRVVVVLSVIDNLTKGAAGQAIQNMNIVFDLPETTGLEHIPLVP